PLVPPSFPTRRSSDLHTYELIKASLTEEKHEMTEKEIFFGPFIVQEKNPVFYQKWEGQLAYYQRLLVNLNKARKKDEDRINEVEDRKSTRLNSSHVSI